MALPFRQRIFLILVALTAVPTALAVVGWALAVRTVGPSAGTRAGWEEVAAAARDMADRIDTTRLAPRERAAVRRLLEQVSTEVTLSRRAETYLRYYTGAFAGVVVVLGAVVVFAGVRLAGHLQRRLSRLIGALVGRPRLIRRRMPLPAGPPTHGAPEFEALRQALRELATALDQARDKELEAERLRAFREVARRVAHEIKNPLTAMRIAVDQVRRSGAQTAVAVDVLSAETDRLDRLAKEFAEFGRLPEGPKSEVDMVDLLVDLGKSAVPPEVAVTVRANGAPCTILGQYDPLRRAFANLLRNAAEAMGGRGRREWDSRDRGGRARDARRGVARPDDAGRARRPANARAAQAQRTGPPCGHDERQGEPHRRRARHQAGRVPIPREAAHPRGRAHDPAGRARAVAHARREPPSARGAGACRSARGREPRDGGAARPDRPGGPHRGTRADHRRVGDGQGARGISHPPPERACGPAVRMREQRRHPEGSRGIRDVRARAGRLHGRHRAARGPLRAGGWRDLVLG